VENNKIKAEELKEMFLSGAASICNKKEYINELNVFPVPDGDTGTNMTLTIQAAAAELKQVKNLTIDTAGKAISSGSLRGARGNSGVILSQLLRGFCRDIQGKEELTVIDVATALQRATETAYKAVMKPKEGTILTVARGVSEEAVRLLEEDDEIGLLEFAEKVLQKAEEVLLTTPELLPVLKEAGVVDSGGQGLVEIIRGIVLCMKGEPVQAEKTENTSGPRGAGLLEAIPSSGTSGRTGSGNDSISTADIKFAYCTEFIILLKEELSMETVESLKEYFLSLGDSLVFVSDEEIAKVHVHTNHPGLAFEKALEYGELTRCKIDNMREEHNERVEMEADRQKMLEQEEEYRKKTEKKENTEPPKKYGIAAVSQGEGMDGILRDTGVDVIISGGQTMNPSTDDILAVIGDLNAENIIILPNNKNIVLAARQAAELCEDKHVIVIPTATIPQGIGALLRFNAEAEPDENEAEMQEGISTVKTGEVTFSVRDTSVDGKAILKGNIMGIDDGGIKEVGTDIAEVAQKLIRTMVDEDDAIITIYYGAEVSEEDAEALAEKVQEEFEDLEVEARFGGQPIYYYVISVEE